MKKLQTNFTTPEQSKRLLELGVPEWTADLYTFYTGKTTIVRNNSYECRKDFFNKTRKDGYKPVWSSIRLIEIMQICCDRVYVLLPNKTDIMQVVTEDICALKDVLDFSKLEE